MFEEQKRGNSFSVIWETKIREKGHEWTPSIDCLLRNITVFVELQ